jgi:hypothetical protein
LHFSFCDDMTLPGTSPTGADIDAVTALIGRTPQGDFRVVVRDEHGGPVVLMNAPLLHDNTPMPTLYWLVGRREVSGVSTLEADSTIDKVEALIGLETIDAIHQRYAKMRDVLIAESHVGPRPTGGVGGTRRGVKCLHAHFAYWLAGGDDAVGQWVADQLDERNIARTQRP